MLVAIAIGTLPQWLTVAAVVAVAVALRGGQIGPALSYLREANETLVKQNHELHGKLEGATRRIVELQQRTDLAPIQAAMVDALKIHELRAQERFEKTTKILDLIAEKLGPEEP